MIKSSESLILQSTGTQDSTEVILGQRKPALRLQRFHLHMSVC